MVQRAANPAFSRANALTMLRIDLLLLKLLFGSFPGSQKGPKMGPEMDPKRDRKWAPKWTRKGTENRSWKEYLKLEAGNDYPQS